MKNRTALSLLTVMLLITAGHASAQDEKATINVQEVSPGLYMLEGGSVFIGGNMGLLVGDDGVILIDDGIEPYGTLLLGTIGDITGDPVNFVINTHVHGDHVGSNEALHMSGATIVAHDNIRKRLVEDGWPTPDGNVKTADGALPVITFADSMSFHLNDHLAFVFHIEKAHTDGDGAIFFAAQNVMYSGDVMFNRLFPFIDLDNGGSVDGFLAGQKKILSMINDDTKIIPGHGHLASKADLQVAIDMLTDSRARVKALVDAGKSADEIVAENPLADYHDEWNWGFITTERMTRTLVLDLTEGM